MDGEISKKIDELKINQTSVKEDKKQASFKIFLGGFLSGMIITGLIGFFYGENLKTEAAKILSYKKAGNLVSETPKIGQTDSASANISLEEKVVPLKGVVLSVKWGNLGKKMLESGVIDSQKFEGIYAKRGGLSDADKKLLYGENNGNLAINSQNSGLILNLLWALGLGNKNPILEKGPMADPQFGGAGNFASTGGWTASTGDSMEHYSKYQFVVLNPVQQKLVEEVSNNIYRPCCGNSTYFPDCNHGMAMLGLLELLAAQGANETEMYKTALIVNSFWFPENYLTIAKYFESEGVSWEKVDAKKVLGPDFSSYAGYAQVRSKVAPVERKGGGGCGV